ncbi:branched-chain amino acid ABC transporter ATPase [Caballeronia mineralivorans PML1(12)]|uniref:Branched-chain amino acid ABC transporter ATPase n=1 Tax=Caballeronia mineralivorans PML1(12) TaxID=908627 RepID=A0A0J1CWJ1_9BURK|nr:ABC transporter ATP-binding protein [Caballeronia mineralivorans]KLU24942.1 branched-chain amino acid ABC transporter ATPase [Caballeronia mineralivorans PML1(12)]
MIEVRDLFAGYTPEVDILHGVSLQVGPIDIVTILGPNGCGKSTLLKAIAGFLLPRSGTITMHGRDVARIPVNRKVCEHGVGFVPQTDNVFGTLTVRENLMLGGHALSSFPREARIEELCEQYPVLRHRYRSPASALSGGERQIVSLARALMPRPVMLLLDEPSAGLSPKMVDEVFDAIVQMRDAEHIGVLMVEQNAIEALRIADRGIVLTMGRVALAGPAADLLESDEMSRLYLGGRAA